MRVKTQEIRWHNTQAIYSLDFQPPHPFSYVRKLLAGQVGVGGMSYKVATGGVDHCVRLWQIHPNILQLSADGQPLHQPRVEYLATLSRHTCPVNCVRFSPNGEMLASAGDDGTILIWVPTSSPVPSGVPGEESKDDEFEKEFWRVKMMCRIGTCEVYDLAWSPSSEFILAGCTDNTARVFRVSDGVCLQQVTDHSHYIQGVAWDPLNSYIATQSSDRSVHVHAIAVRGADVQLKSIAKNSKMECVSNDLSRPKSEDMPPLVSTSRSDSFDSTSAAGVKHSDTPSLSAVSPPSTKNGDERPQTNQHLKKLTYGDESYTSYFRRLSFSPDGALLLTPCALFEDTTKAPESPTKSENNTQPSHKPTTKSCVLVYSRANITKQPIALIPGGLTATLAVRFSPILYELRNVSGKRHGEPLVVGIVKGANTSQDLNGKQFESRDLPPEPLSAFDLPYRMYYAVATRESVMLFDTQQASPIAIFGGLHLQPFTDISWSPDGQTLMLASSDGYCTLVVFDRGELGELHTTQQHNLQTSSSAERNDHEIPTGPSTSQGPAASPTKAVQELSKHKPINETPGCTPKKTVEPSTINRTIIIDSPKPPAVDAIVITSSPIKPETTLILQQQASAQQVKKKRRVELQKIGDL